MQNFTEQTVLRDYLRIFYRHKIFFIIIPISLILPLYIGFQIDTPTYTAEVKMFVKATKKTEADYYNVSVPPNPTAEHIELVMSNIVLKRVVEALKLYERPLDLEKKYATPLKKALIDYRFSKLMSEFEKMSPEQKNKVLFDNALGNLSSNISAIPVRDSSLFTISVTDFDGAMATIIANSVSRSYVMFDLEQQIEELKLKYGEKYSTVLQLESYIEEYKNYLDGKLIPDMEAMGPASVKIIAQATGASFADKVSKNVLLVVAFLVGIFSAVVFSFLSEYFDDTFKTPKEVVQYLNMPFIGSIPKRKKNDELIMSDEHLARSSLKCVNSFQSLGDKICLLSKQHNIKTILITAFQRHSDTSALIANLGIYLSRDAGKKVLIIDANLVNPSLAKAFHISDDFGLPELFERRKTLEEVVVRAGSNLDLLLSHAVSYRPVAVLDSSFMPDLINGIKDKYDFVFIDCSADMRRDTDSVILSSLADAVILVVNEGVDRFRDAQIVMKNLDQNGSRLIFSVLNNRKEDMPQILYKIA
jgi:capsular polysaccharide biosynthesis protein